MKLLILIIVFSYGIIYSCTSGIVSGKSTADGRPLLWKHRDSGEDMNKLSFFKGEKYDYVGVVNSIDKKGEEIWMGTNSAGFSIMNTMSYNINEGIKCNVPDDQEGLFMKKALSVCGDVNDFEKLLKESSGKYGNAANFGVIDAKGGAAYFETGYYKYTKFDVNDVKVAPMGYLIRTNFSFDAPKEKGLGYFRYQSTEDLFYSEYIKGKFTAEFLLTKADRSMKHSVTKTDLYNGDYPKDTTEIVMVPFRDYIVRNSTVSSLIVQGVKKGEDPKLTTMWTVLGFPLTTLVTPIWVETGNMLPSSVTVKDSGTALVNAKSLILKDKCFPLKIENGKDYINYSYLFNQKGSGVMQKLIPKESAIINKTIQLQNKWYKSGFDKNEALEFYKWLDNYINDTYKNEYGI